MGLLQKMNLLKSRRTLKENVFDSLFGEKTFLEIDYKTPSDYVAKYWKAYNDELKNRNINNSNTIKNLNGAIFELIIYTLFIREGLLPIYLQAKVAFIPNVEYDLIIYNKEVGPISISLKTSLRERKKQADLEAIALKYVHRKSECYLISMDEQEVSLAKREIKEGCLLGLNDVILANDSEFDNFIKDLKSRSFTEAGMIEIISSNQIVTSEIVSQYGNNSK